MNDDVVVVVRVRGGGGSADDDAEPVRRFGKDFPLDLLGRARDDGRDEAGPGRRQTDVENETDGVVLS